MAVYLANTADGGTNGTNATAGNSGGTSGPAWDAVNAGTGATNAYDNTHVLGGHPLSYKLATGGTATTVYLQWGPTLTGSSIPQVWFRSYLYFTANPGAGIRIWAANASGSLGAAVNVLTTGQLRFIDSASATIFTTTATIALNAWCRIEGYVIGAASTGQVELRYYATPDAAPQNYTEIHTSAASQATVGALTVVRFGTAANTANIGPYWLASPGVSDTSYLGPEAPVSGIPVVTPSPLYLSRIRPLNPYPRPWKVSSQRAIQQTLPATVATAATVQDQVSRTLAGTVATTGAVQDQVAKALPATVTTTGALSRNPGKSFTATVTTTGSLSRQAGKALAATVTVTGTLGRALSRAFTATIATAPALARTVARTFTATVAVTVSLVRNPGKTLSATTATAGTLARNLGKTFPVTVTVTTSVTRTLTRTLATTANTTAALARQVAKTLPATVATAGALGRAVGKILSAAVSLLGAVTNQGKRAAIQPAVITITPAGPASALVAVIPVTAADVTVSAAGPLAAQVALAPAIAAVVTVTPQGPASATVTVTAG